MNSYPKGATIKLTAEFRTAGVLTDPATVTLRIEDPAGTETSYTYAAGTVTKDSTGIFSKTLAFATAGEWYYRFEGTGAAAGVAETEININAGHF